MNHYDLKQIKERHDLRDTAERLGLHVIKHKVCCPFHGERTASCHLYSDHFHCYGCGARGDVVDLVKQVLGKNFQDACEWLEGGGCMVPTRTAPARKERHYPLDVAHLEGLLARKTLTPVVEAFLKDRCINMDALTGMKDIGCLAQGAAFFQRGNSFFLGDSLLFALRDARGCLISVQARACTYNISKWKKYKVVPDQPLGLLGLFTLRGYDGRQPIVVCEGPTDWMALRTCGFRHVVAFIGAKSVKKGLLGQICEAAGGQVVPRLHVFPDRDDAGQKFVAGLRLQGQEMGIQVEEHSAYAQLEGYGWFKDFGELWALAGKSGRTAQLKAEIEGIMGHGPAS